MQADGRLPVEQRRNYRNVFHGLWCVFRSEGVAGLYRGLGPLFTRGMMVTTAQFSTYDQAKEILIKKVGLDDNLPAHFGASSCAGLVAAIVSTPLDVFKSRMMNR